MKTATDLHHTSEEVMETGHYVCAAGDKRELNRGDRFPACPQSGKDTTWRHTNHHHKTGELVREAGQYIDADGERMSLNVGNKFPSCPKTGNNTTWIHA